MLEQLSNEWFAARVGRITGSRIATVLGHSPWQTRTQLLREMVAEAKGQPVRIDSEAMRWGRDHERVAIESLQATIDEPMVLGGWYELGDDIGFSPDAHVPGKLLIEAKCPISFQIPDEPPRHYVDQCQLGLRVLGLDEAALHYWTPQRTETFFLYRDETWGAEALPAIAEFLVEYRNALDDPAMWPMQERDDSEWAMAVERYRRAKHVADTAASDLEYARDALIALTGNTPSSGCGAKVEWIDRVGTVQWMKLAKDLGIGSDVQDKYRGKSTRYARVIEECGE